MCPSGELAIKSDLQISGHLTFQQSIPPEVRYNAQFPTPVDPSQIQMLPNSSDTSGAFQFQGVTQPAAGEMVSVAYNKQYNPPPFHQVFITPNNTEAATLLQGGYYVSPSTGGFLLYFVNPGVATGATFSYFSVKSFA